MKDIAKKVTVIVPCHNEERSISRTLRAILAQRDEAGAPIGEWGEVIVIDDESIDRSPSILKSLQDEYPFLQVVRNQPRRGLAGSYNRAIGLAAAPVLLMCHADCRMLSDSYVFRVTRLFEDPSVGAVTGKPTITGVKSLPFAEKAYLATHLLEIDSEPSLVREINFAEGRCDGFRKQALEAVGLFDEETRISGEDQIISNGLRRRGFRILQDTSLRYELSSGSSQSSLGRIIRRHIVLSRGQAYVFKTSGTETSYLAQTSPNRASRKRLRALQVLELPLLLLLLACWSVTRQPVVFLSIALLVVVRIFLVLQMARRYFKSQELPLFVPLALICDVAYGGGFLWGFLRPRKRS
jgi:cellulose synthase/poly-beta-1,6-N-acetylglucosamine synthase-like glycosyltransferase